MFYLIRGIYFVITLTLYLPVAAAANYSIICCWSLRLYHVFPNQLLDRRETRPKILWNTGSKLQEAKDKTANTVSEDAAAKLEEKNREKEKEKEKEREREKALKKGRELAEDSWRIGGISLDEVRTMKVQENRMTAM